MEINRYIVGNEKVLCIPLQNDVCFYIGIIVKIYKMLVKIFDIKSFYVKRKLIDFDKISFNNFKCSLIRHTFKRIKDEAW